MKADLSQLVLSHIHDWCLGPYTSPDANRLRIHNDVVTEMQWAGYLFRAPMVQAVVPWVRNTKKRALPCVQERHVIDAEMHALACGCKPPWQASFEEGLADAAADIHKLELLKQTFRTQHGDAADPHVISDLAYVDALPSTLFHPGHPSGWWMLKHVLGDGDVDNDASRPRVAPCPHLVYEFVLHIKRQWPGYGWYMGWKLVCLLRGAFGCTDLVLSDFPGMTASNRRAIAALAADQIYNPQGLCVYSIWVCRLARVFSDSS